VKKLNTKRKICKWQRKTVQLQKEANTDLNYLIDDLCAEEFGVVKVKTKPVYRVPVQRARARAYRSPMRSIHVGSIAACAGCDDPGGGGGAGSDGDDVGFGDQSEPPARRLYLSVTLPIKKPHSFILAVTTFRMLPHGFMQSVAA